MKKLYSLILLFICCVHSFAQPKEYTHKDLLSFENGISPFTADKNSMLTSSAEHAKHLSKSLKWEWNMSKAQISISQNIPYLSKKQVGNENAISTFIFWLYRESALPGQKLRFEFLKKGKLCCYFEYGLDFKGWRSSWVAFNRDMQGVPEENMDELRIIAPDTKEGVVWLDHIILSSLQDSRYHTADFQAPYINKKSDSHWLILLKSWKNPWYLPMQQKLTASQLSGIETIEKRVCEIQLSENKPKAIDVLRERFNQYHITENQNGTLQGVPLFFERYGETYAYLNAPKYSTIFGNEMGISKFNDLLQDLAVSYHKSTDLSAKKEIEKMYILLTKYMLEQGFAAGSAMGTLHHLGYSMRNYYPSMLMMKASLQKAGISNKVKDAMLWFAGTGEVKLKPIAPGMDIDAFNTSLIGRLAGILMMDNSPEKVNYLQSLVAWINNGFKYSDGSAGCYKIDGTVYHHRNNYPAYAVGGMTGALTAIEILQKTDFAIEKAGHENIKKALLAMRIYCNLQTWPLSISGRHPDGEGKLIPKHYAQLALVGSPDGKEEIDTELAAAYLRLISTEETKYSKQFKSKGIKAEAAPNGNYSFNYSSLNIHRRDNWMVAAKGFSRYIWAAETYKGANHYGRYMNHGSLQILASGEPVDMFQSGYSQQGWDWNHFPGTTATVLPIKELKSNILNVDAFSGEEEMLLSDESYAGSISLGNKQGMYAMKLHENDKYNGSLYARKSFFLIDNRVIALGSNIKSKLDKGNTHSTLFQNHLPSVNSPIVIDNLPVSAFPYQSTLTKPLTALSDGLNNYFYTKNGNVEVKRSRQHSLHEETDQPTQEDFSLAVIDHGAAPVNGKYEYMIAVQPDSSEQASYYKAMQNEKTQPYKILEQDSLAHIVYDKSTKITGYALFEAGKVNCDSQILNASAPCLIMTDAGKNGLLTLSLTDPDLHFYEGKADDIFDKNGKTIERSIYSRKWINNPSGISTVDIEINGKWDIKVPNPNVSILSSNSKSTILRFSCQHGISRELTLKSM